MTRGESTWSTQIMGVRRILVVSSIWRLKTKLYDSMRILLTKSTVWWISLWSIFVLRLHVTSISIFDHWQMMDLGFLGFMISLLEETSFPSSFHKCAKQVESSCMIGAHTHTHTRMHPRMHTNTQSSCCRWCAQLAANLLFANNLEVFPYRTF